MFFNDLNSAINVGDGTNIGGLNFNGSQEVVGDGAIHFETLGDQFNVNGTLNLGALVTGLDNVTFTRSAVGEVDLTGGIIGDMPMQNGWGSWYIDAGELADGTFSNSATDGSGNCSRPTAAARSTT